MPLTPPFPFKSAPDPVAPVLPPVQIVRQPVLSINFIGGCDSANAALVVDQMPTMNRQPQAIPDQPGGGYSYAGMGLEYVDLGVRPPDLGPQPGRWSGLGAHSWTVWADGVPVNLLGPYEQFDGAVGPFSIFITGMNWRLPHTYWLTATYHDRPTYLDFYFDPTSIGIVAFGEGIPPHGAPCVGPSVFWNRAGYWDPWVQSHQFEADAGPLDRYGVAGGTGLTGPWGSFVPQQHIRSDDAPPCLDAYAATLLDFANSVTYPEITYSVETSHQRLDPCQAIPVFDQTRGIKVHH